MNTLCVVTNASSNARRFYSKCNLVLGVLGFAITTYLRFPLYFQVACATRPQTVTMVIKRIYQDDIP